MKKIGILLLMLLFMQVTFAVENQDRGMVALPMGGGNVYLGWRLLEEDQEDVAFNIYRSKSSEEAYIKLNSDPIIESTNFVDKTTIIGETYVYKVVPVLKGTEETGSRPVLAMATQKRRDYIGIKLQGDYDFQKCAIADLDGDGAYDYVIKQPGDNIDPYALYWRPSEYTYKIEAYRSDGTFLWRHDMGWSIEGGVWYSPYIAFDCDGDGKAEVYTKYGEGDGRGKDGRVGEGEEFLARLNGMTGKLEKRVPWHDRTGFGPQRPDRAYNYASRNFLAIAFLDGKTPSVIMQRGTYDIIKTAALDAELKQLWYWDSAMEEKRYDRQGSHGLLAADVDGDGRDELVYGAACLDDNGQGMWTLEMGHPDVCYVGDINREHPGLEVFYGFESRQDQNGVCLVDAKSGKILWGYDAPTTHVHNQGMCADILANQPGLECFAGEKDGSRHWLYNAEGHRIADKQLNDLSPRPVRWDDSPEQEVLIRRGSKAFILTGEDVATRNVSAFEDRALLIVEGRPIAIADCLGDWREEIITSVKGELRIYTTTRPAEIRLPCLMQDRLYRNYVASGSMGYWYPPVVSQQLSSRFWQIRTRPIDYGLFQNHPNPFVPEIQVSYQNPFNLHTRIAYQLLEATDVSLTIYNILGQPVRTLIREQQPSGFYSLVWDGKDGQGHLVSSGVYLLRMAAGPFGDAQKILLLK